MNTPHGLAEIRATYGDIRTAVVNGKLAIVSPPRWEQANMVLVRDLPGFGPRPLFVHRLMAGPLRAALEAAKLACPDYLINTMGCWNVRPKRVNGDLSTHSWGIAVDINAKANPQTRPGKPIVRDIPDAFGEAFEAAGFVWGLRFASPDPQHFQLASGY